MAADTVLPIGRTTVAATQTGDLTSALPVLSLGVRSGPELHSLGYVKTIKRTHTRKIEAVMQLEPYAGSVAPVGFGNNTIATLVSSEYYPGERAEVVPGPITAEQVDLDRTVLYSSTLFEAVMRSNSAGSHNLHGAVAAEEAHINTGKRYMNTLQQIRPVILYELYVSPINGDILWGIQYEDCWFTGLDRSVSSENTVIVESCKLEVTRTRLYEPA